MIPISNGESQEKQDLEGKPSPAKPQKAQTDFSLSELDALLEALPGSGSPPPAPAPPLPARKEAPFVSLADLLTDLELPEGAPSGPTGARPAAQVVPPPPPHGPQRPKAWAP